MEARNFIENYQETDLEKDPLPIKVLRNAIIKDEIPGQAVQWAFEYLDQRSCPLHLITHLVQKLNTEVRGTDFSQCTEATDDSVDSGNDAATRYEPLKLMRAIVKILDDICLKEKEDYQDSVDGIVESPDMQPHVFAVSYNNIKNTRRFMEDRMTVLPRMDRIFKLENPMSYFGVFDGHNGSEAAAYGAAQLHQYLIQSLEQCPDVISSISDAFERLDDAFVQKCLSGKVKSGSTAVLSIIMPDKLFVAWVGDSQAVLAKRTEVNNLVTPHKPERADEIDRIRRMGGEVFQMNGTYRVNGNLAVSRAIGDADDKSFIISTPDIKMLELDGTEEFIILACDGLWDEITPEAAAQIVRHQVVNDTSNVSAVSQKLIQQAKHYGSTDNISVIVVFLEALESIKNRYEAVLGTEIDLSVFRKVNEPAEQIPIDQQIENSMDRNLGLVTELNGHGKDSEQLVDFLSFGSSRESGAQIIGDDGNHFGDDIAKKEVEEDISDGESDDEWQFEKPIKPEDPIVNNGLSENPFGDTATSGENLGHAINQSEPSQETTAESLNPFSIEDDEFGGNLVCIQPITGETPVNTVSEAQDLISNSATMAATLPTPTVTEDLIADVTNEVSNMNPFHYEHSETAAAKVNSDIQKPTEVDFGLPVKDISESALTSGQENASNPFGIGNEELVMLETPSTELNAQVQNLGDGQNAFDPFSQNVVGCQNVFDTFSQNVVESENAFDTFSQNVAESQNAFDAFSSSGVEIKANDDATIISGIHQVATESLIDTNVSSSFQDEDKYLAQVESNPIPEDLAEEIDMSNVNVYGSEFLPGTNEPETNPFSGQLQDDHQQNHGTTDLLEDAVLATVTAPPSKLNEETLNSPVDQLNLPEEKMEEPEKYEQELLVDDVHKRTSAVINNQSLVAELAEPLSEDRIENNQVAAAAVEDGLAVEVIFPPTLREPLPSSLDLSGANAGAPVQNNEDKEAEEEPEALNLNDDLGGGDQPRDLAADQDYGVLNNTNDTTDLTQNNAEMQSAEKPSDEAHGAFDDNRNVMSPELEVAVEKVENVEEASAPTNGHLTPSDLQFESSAVSQEADQAIIMSAAQPSIPPIVETKAKITSKPKVDAKTAPKTLKSPAKAEVSPAKARTVSSTAAALAKKSPAKTNADLAAKSGLSGPKPATGTKAPVSKPGMQRPAPSKGTGVGAAASAAGKATTGRTLGVTRSSPLNVSSDGKTTSKPSTTAAPRARPTTAPAPPSTTTRPAASAAAKAITSPKRVAPLVGPPTRPPATRTAAAGTVKIDSASKPLASAPAGAPKPRPRPTSTTEIKSAAETKRLPLGPRPAATASSISSKLAARPLTIPSRPQLGLSSARTTAPTKSLTSTSTGASKATTLTSRAPLKPNEKSATAPSRTTSRVMPPSKPSPATGPKKIDTKSKKPTPAAPAKVAPPAIKKVTKVAEKKKDNLELIPQNGPEPTGMPDGLKELNVMNGMNGDINGETEIEKQDAIKENGVHTESAIQVAPVDDLLQ